MTSIATTPAWLAGIRYKSGRTVYCTRTTHAGGFVTTADTAHPYPSAQAAREAAEALLRSWEVRNPSELTIITPACHES